LKIMYNTDSSTATKKYREYEARRLKHLLTVRTKQMREFAPSVKY